MTVALAAASGAETLEAELAARGDAIAAMALRLLRGIDAAANPITYLKPIAKAVKFPGAIVEWLTRGSKARKAADEAAAAEHLAAELARGAANAWTKTEEGSRVAAALSRANESVEILVELTAAQRDALPTIHELIAAGKVRAAIERIDALVAEGMSRDVATKLEEALAKAEGKTSPAMYRDPVATVDGSKEQFKPGDASRRLRYGTDELSPEVVFEHGLAARGTNTELVSHANQRGDSAYRGTTLEILLPGRNLDGAAGAAGNWAGAGGWVYEIDGTPSWDVNSALEGRVRQPDGSFGGNPVRGERERAILANVPSERIVGAYPIYGTEPNLRHGELIPNPNYVPVRTPSTSMDW